LIFSIKIDPSFVSFRSDISISRSITVAIPHKNRQETAKNLPLYTAVYKRPSAAFSFSSRGIQKHHPNTFLQASSNIFIFANQHCEIFRIVFSSF
jgi:hypothetical protein